MTAAVLPRPELPTPVPSSPAPPAPGGAATAYQRVLHRAVHRELRLLAELASWATTDDAGRTTELTEHADLVARVLLAHHAVERERLWPALLRSLPAAEVDGARRHLLAWTDRTAPLDSRLRDLSTATRQWAVAGTGPARDAFVRACGLVADAVAEPTAADEADLLPLLAAHLPAGEWAAAIRASGSTLSGREQMLVLGLVLEDASAIDRARVLAALPPAVRTAWRAVGRRNHRAAVVRLRGAPPAL
ncbi:hemerythrin domain-containing protein [Blastococcus sp. BMG 814]|uniref:Hemerythrin domain-containing protein n=1 Tax=Blastococcus carthaginiensis TaxID=3050034 RepID=A0ABT9IFS8_9ACTN|nr:hemerythrin domain-containing protein [Blastococcus carthaginiensis]MDP5184432.1 hemerythrin domain-containing protein [Blastococcus carthaginiensis]